MTDGSGGVVSIDRSPGALRDGEFSAIVGDCCCWRFDSCQCPFDYLNGPRLDVLASSPDVGMGETQDFVFSEKAGQYATDAATLTLYQVLLGRDPENPQVIEESKTQRIEALFRSFVRSEEFADVVVSPLTRGVRLRHELRSPVPNPVQRDWLASLLVLPAPQHSDMRAATSWRAFFRALLGSSVDVPQEVPVNEESSKAAIGPSLIDITLGELSTLELRLNRIKELLRQIGSKPPHG